MRGDTVSVMLENRVEYLAALIALEQAGAKAALLNTNLTGGLLYSLHEHHRLEYVYFRRGTAGRGQRRARRPGAGECNDVFVCARCGRAGLPSGPLTWPRSRPMKTARTPETGRMTLGDTALYIFTSGTTGMPKAAVLSNRRYLMTAALS